MVPKPNGKVRITGDFKNTVNSQLCVNQYPLSNPDDLFASIAGGEKFSKLDGQDAYHQIELDEASKKFVVVNTHRGLYRYNVLPQGIASSPSIFQQFSDKIFKDIPMSGSFLDDGICSGKSDQQHLYSLKTILQRMREVNYHLSRDKCMFLKRRIEFLGHIITEKGLHTSPQKVEAIANIKSLRDVTEVRSFLGLINFYGKFVPLLADICAPMYRLLKNDVQWKWTKECESAFVTVKAKLMSNELLAHFNPELPIGISCDASNQGLGVVLFHRYPDGTERPIQFASKILTPTEGRYWQIEREGLSIIFGVKKFFKYLYGRKFIMITDHKPLLAIFGPKTGLPPLAATRLHHWSLYLSQFQYTVEYRNTKDHGNADALSRLATDSSTLTDVFDFRVNLVVEENLNNMPVTAAAIRTAISKDKIIARVIMYQSRGWPKKLRHEDEILRPYFLRRDELHLQQNVLLWGMRVVIPTKFCSKLLDELHSCHMGIVRMKALARQHVWWPGIDEDIEKIGKSCVSCSENRPNTASA